MEAVCSSMPLSEQVEVIQNLLEQNGRRDQAEDIGQLIYCLQSIQTNLAEAMEEVSYLMRQIQPVEEQGMRVRLERMQEETRESLCRAGKQVQVVAAEVSGGIRNAMQAVKGKGVKALDHILDAAHVSQGLSRAEALLVQAVSGLERKIEAVDCMAEEFHAMKGHAKNIGRAVTGKSVEEIAVRDKTIGVMAKIRAGMEYCKKLLAGLGEKALAARAHVEHLRQTAERCPEKAASVQEIAKELRDASAIDSSRQPKPAQVRS